MSYFLFIFFNCRTCLSVFLSHKYLRVKFILFCVHTTISCVVCRNESVCCFNGRLASHSLHSFSCHMASLNQSINDDQTAADCSIKEQIKFQSVMVSFSPSLLYTSVLVNFPLSEQWAYITIYWWKRAQTKAESPTLKPLC